MNKREGFTTAEPDAPEVETKDENLLVQYEDKEVAVYWVSVYGSKFHRAPKGFFIQQPTYREFCLAIGRKVPPYRIREKFDDYVRARLAAATVKEILPGMEEGVVIGHAIFHVVADFHNRAADYDHEDKKNVVSRGDPVFFETLDGGPGYREMFFRVNYLMDGITFFQANAKFERKIGREEVCEWLVRNGRGPYPRVTSPNRLRSTYPVPYILYLRWKHEDVGIDKIGKDGRYTELDMYEEEYNKVHGGG